MQRFDEFDRTEPQTGQRRVPEKKFCARTGGAAAPAAGKPDLNTGSSAVWNHVKYSGQGISQPWYSRLQALKQRK
ncbi:hypothetical protein [Paenibacillus pinistramenti]|uniref:hypothetical protein n=1 Tax=Paenibacillus pinistramenti TaxID=1768003 RepID=UPI001108BF07|nr:hypothetical protein [Paenibacillus pinistramenti]